MKHIKQKIGVTTSGKLYSSLLKVFILWGKDFDLHRNMLFFVLLFPFSSLPSFYIFLSLVLQCSPSWYMIQHSAQSQTWPYKTFYCEWNEKSSCSDIASPLLKLLELRLARCQQSSPEKSFFPLRINKGSSR